MRVHHAVAEEGVPFVKISEAISQGLHLPLVSKTDDEAKEHFGWFAPFAALNCSASSTKTRKTLGWETKETGLINDIERADYFLK